MLCSGKTRLCPCFARKQRKACFMRQGTGQARISCVCIGNCVLIGEIKCQCQREKNKDTQKIRRVGKGQGPAPAGGTVRECNARCVNKAGV